MRVNIYPERSDKPVRIRKWVRDAVDAQSFCDWWQKTFGQKVYYVFTR